MSFIQVIVRDTGMYQVVECRLIMGGTTPCPQNLTDDIDIYKKKTLVHEPNNMNKLVSE